ncbi:MAG: hypothetical protein QM658_06740 [Gordonia sp. (in: high G+C Gram-positive bacteria)]
MSDKDGVYILNSAESDAGSYFVDAHRRGERPGEPVARRDGLPDQPALHDCALTCEGYTDYVPWLNKPSPVSVVRRQPGACSANATTLTVVAVLAWPATGFFAWFRHSTEPARPTIFVGYLRPGSVREVPRTSTSRLPRPRRW